METKTCIVLWVLILATSVYITTCNALSTHDVGYEDKVKTHCGFTRYPTLCVQTLGEKQHVDFLSALVNKTISETNLHHSNFEILSTNFVSPEAQLARVSIDYCHSLATMSLKRLNQAMDALQNSPEQHKEDIQTWLSAAITFQETCKDAIEDIKSSYALIEQIYKKMDQLQRLASNSLALANRIMEKPKGKSVTGRRLLKDQQAETFPSWISAKDRKLLQSETIYANVVVAEDGSGDYTTVSAAIDAATGGRFVIYVKAGTYNGKINTNKDGITLIGEGRDSTIITGSGSVVKGSSLSESATFTITGDGFIARDISFQNTAGPLGEQAVALSIASDHSVLFRCSLLGYQDTLYALAFRQFYRECDIYGTIDFIFGNAVAVFQSCTLSLRRPYSGSYDVIVASGRSDPGQNTGFNLQNCKITLTPDFSSGQKAYLGRPWKAYSRAIVMQSNIDGAIASEGWIEWPTSGGSAFGKTLYFAEYENMGPGAGTSGRVNWPGFSVIQKLDATKFTVGSFIGGNAWLPSTGITFLSGL